MNNILNSEDTFNEGGIEVKNVKLAKLAEYISKKENISYSEALIKASKKIKE